MFKTETPTGRFKYSSFTGHSQPINFWTQRSLLEKNLLSIILILFVTVMVMLLNFVNLPQSAKLVALDSGPLADAAILEHKMFKRDTIELEKSLDLEAILKVTTGENSPEICFSEGCIHTASKLLNNMNQKVDPCDDFYRFTCGKFLEETVMPDDKPSLTSFTVIGDVLETQLRVIMEEPIKESDIKPFKLAKNFYKVCMNKSQIEHQGLDHMKYVLKHLGGWPVLEGDSWNEGAFSWTSTVYKFRRYGYSFDHFMVFGVGVNLKNTTERLLTVDQASLGLSREYLVKGLSDNIVKAYHEYMIDIAVIMGADRQRAVEELTESLNFQIKLANITLPREERRNITKSYNPMKVVELQEKYPSIPWLEYMNTILSPKAEVNSDETIMVAVPSYIHSLEQLLSTTPKRVMANYAMWRVMDLSVGFLTEPVRAREFAFTSAISGVSEQEPRWKKCLSTAGDGFSLAIGSLYIRKHFKEAAKSNAEEMVQLIREEMYKILGTIDWMDDDTRKAALDKAKSMTNHIAYPAELLDDKKLEEFYNGLELETDNLLEAYLNLAKFFLDYSFSLLRKPVNNTDWVTHGNPAVVNAFYLPNENSIQFPAATLQGTFFSNDRPNYMNFGAIGFIIGHEITHGFDDQGRQFDKDGNFVDWWAESTKKKFLAKAQCIIDQYGNYTVPEVNLSLNGINTQGENIADNGGIKEAYNAYNVWVSRHGEEARLPGLQQYSPKQLFWISAGSTWCSVYRPEVLKITILLDTHSPPEFRILGPLSNQKEFAKDFNCPVGSRQNPVKKCEVW